MWNKLGTDQPWVNEIHAMLRKYFFFFRFINMLELFKRAHGVSQQFLCEPDLVPFWNISMLKLSNFSTQTYLYTRKIRKIIVTILAQNIRLTCAPYLRFRNISHVSNGAIKNIDVYNFAIQSFLRILEFCYFRTFQFFNFPDSRKPIDPYMVEMCVKHVYDEWSWIW